MQGRVVHCIGLDKVQEQAFQGYMCIWLIPTSCMQEIAHCSQSNQTQPNSMPVQPNVCLALQPSSLMHACISQYLFSLVRQTTLPCSTVFTINSYVVTDKTIHSIVLQICNAIRLCPFGNMFALLCSIMYVHNFAICHTMALQVDD